jgi:sigma-B regulation protein RsbU (phosphoserine phosphatase)
MLPDSRFVDCRCEIKDASVLYVFSDGIYEIRLEDGGIWGLDAFVKLLAQNQGLPLSNCPGSSLEAILNSVKAVNPGESFEDDVSLLKVNFF